MGGKTITCCQQLKCTLALILQVSGTRLERRKTALIMYAQQGFYPEPTCVFIRALSMFSTHCEVVCFRLCVPPTCFSFYQREIHHCFSILSLEDFFFFFLQKYNHKVRLKDSGNPNYAQRLVFVADIIDFVYFNKRSSLVVPAYFYLLPLSTPSCFHLLVSYWCYKPSCNMIIAIIKC